MLDLIKILKDCPKGTKLYSTIHGEVAFDRVEVAFDHVDDTNIIYPIVVKYNDSLTSFTGDGKYYIEYDGECVLFPSKDQRDWSKFKAPVKKFDYSTLKPFDKVLVRDNDRDIWRCSLFTCFRKDQIVCEVSWVQGIPDNDETKHLVGTTDKPDEKYIWWEE